MQQVLCKIGAREQNDFVEQITISYWLFYALLNNQQFMKTKFHKYRSRLLSRGFLHVQPQLHRFSEPDSFSQRPFIFRKAAVKTKPVRSAGLPTLLPLPRSTAVLTRSEEKPQHNRNTRRTSHLQPIHDTTHRDLKIHTGTAWWLHSLTVLVTRGSLCVIKCWFLHLALTLLPRAPNTDPSL